MTDLLITGGTVVTAERSFAADVAIRDGRISGGGPRLGQRYPQADTLDARGLLVLPGCVDVHTHTRLPTDEEPDRFYQDSVAAAFGGTTTFLAFNNPGTGISERGSASLLAGLDEFRARTDGEGGGGLRAVLGHLRPAGGSGRGAAGADRARACRRPRRSWSTTSACPMSACSPPCR